MPRLRQLEQVGREIDRGDVHAELGEALGEDPGAAADFDDAHARRERAPRAIMSMRRSARSRPAGVPQPQMRSAPSRTRYRPWANSCSTRS